MSVLRVPRLALALALAALTAAADDLSLGAPAAPLAAPREMVALEAGAELRTRPSRSAPVVTILDDATAAELVEERDGWRRVRVGTVTGWLAPAAGGPGTGNVPEIDSARLERALALLPATRRELRAGAVTLCAGEADVERLARWARVAESALAAWPGRLGVEPVRFDGTVVVFAPGGPARADDVDNSDPPEAPGSAGGGVGLVQLGERSDDQVEALLVHELSHLASERTFVRPLPLWLEEGIAEWLAREPLGGDGYGLEGELRGEVAIVEDRRERRVDLSGPIADLARLAREAEHGTLPQLDEWTALPAFELSSERERATRYALAGSFARFLFEADVERAASVRDALAAAATADVDLDAELAVRLGDVGELDLAFRAWLVADFERRLATIR